MSVSVFISTESNDLRSLHSSCNLYCDADIFRLQSYFSVVLIVLSLYCRLTLPFGGRRLDFLFKTIVLILMMEQPVKLKPQKKSIRNPSCTSSGKTCIVHCETKGFGTISSLTEIGFLKDK